MSRRTLAEKGMAVALSAVLMVFAVPAAGLAIDAGVLYAIKAKLSASTDAAALAAARSLVSGLTISEQTDSAISRANAFFDANFPDGYLGARNKSVNVQVTESGFRTRTVDVQASADAPTLFMKVLGLEASTVRAEGRASRRDVNLILVLDRSGSMNSSNSCAPMRNAAVQFVNMFANQRDRLGLVTFGATYYNAFPSSTNFKPGLANQLGQIVCSGYTNTAMALWQAYQQLVAINQPGALNMIVFFTDGIPNGITASFPIKTLQDSRYGYGQNPYNNWNQSYNNMPPSPCSFVNTAVHATYAQTYAEDHLPATPTYVNPNWNPYWLPPNKTGVISQGSSFASTGQTVGLMNTTAISHNNTNETGIAGSNGCAYSGNNLSRVRRDIAYIPDQDAYGNSTTGGYANPGANDRFPAGHPYQNRLRPDKPSTIGVVSQNAAYNAARRIRQDANLDPVIFTIGLGDPSNSEPPNQDFMRRISNDPNSPEFSTSEQPGLYVFAPSNAQLNLAFVRIASEILRIAR